MEPEVTKPADGMTDYGLIELSGSENTRDQGGMETVTGQRVRAKKLIRSDKLEKLTDHDIHVLVDEYELRTVIDLRTAKERELSPDPTSRMPEVKFVNLPVFTEGAVGITHEHDIRSLMKEFSQMKEDPYKIVRNIYPMALLGDEAVKAYKQFFDILLEQEGGRDPVALLRREGSHRFGEFAHLACAWRAARDDHGRLSGYEYLRTQEASSCCA